MYIIKAPPNLPKGEEQEELVISYGDFSKGVHLFPYRTEKLSPLWPMVLVFQLGE